MLTVKVRAYRQAQHLLRPARTPCRCNPLRKIHRVSHNREVKAASKRLGLSQLESNVFGFRVFSKDHKNSKS